MLRCRNGWLMQSHSCLIGSCGTAAHPAKAAKSPHGTLAVAFPCSLLSLLCGSHSRRAAKASSRSAPLHAVWCKCVRCMPPVCPVQVLQQLAVTAPTEKGSWGSMYASYVTWLEAYPQVCLVCGFRMCWAAHAMPLCAAGLWAAHPPLVCRCIPCSVGCLQRLLQPAAAGGCPAASAAGHPSPCPATPHPPAAAVPHHLPSVAGPWLSWHAPHSGQAECNCRALRSTARDNAAARGGTAARCTAAACGSTARERNHSGSPCCTGCTSQPCC